MRKVLLRIAPALAMLSIGILLSIAAFALEMICPVLRMATSKGARHRMGKPRAEGWRTGRTGDVQERRGGPTLEQPTTATCRLTKNN